MSFLIRLNAHVGETLRLGGRNFKITAVLKQEPDRMSAGAGLGPRVMISNAALDRTGLLAPGSRASHRLLLKLPAKVDQATVRKQIEEALPDAQVMDFKEGNPALSQGLENATAILSLICLVAMVLGAIGVAMAMHAHLEQRMDMLAILKAVGARSSDLLRIFLLQTLGLGLAGGVLGVAAGVGVMAALPAVFGKLLPVHTVLGFPWRSVAAGLGNGSADYASFLPAAAAGCARNQAGAGVATAGGAGAERIPRMDRSVVGAAAAAGAFGAGGAGIGRNCLGVVGLSESGRLVCAAVCNCACGAAAAGGGGAADIALRSESRAVAAAVVVAAWTGESVPAGQPIGRGAGGAGHGRDADSGRLSDAGIAACAICARRLRRSCRMCF